MNNVIINPTDKSVLDLRYLKLGTVASSVSASDWLDQAVKTTSSPTFNIPTVSGLTFATYNMMRNGPASGNFFLYGAGNATMSGTYNQGIFPGAVDGITTGSSNIGIGFQALGAVTEGYGNTAIGSYAGANITTGGSNFALGYFALGTLTTGSNNTAMGSDALRGITLASGGNTAYGASAGASITTANGCTYIGAYANAYDTVTTVSYSGAFGYVGRVARDNTYVIGPEQWPYTSWIGFGVAYPNYFLSLNGEAARTIAMERHPTTNSAGYNLTVMAGGSTKNMVATISITAAGSGYHAADVLTIYNAQGGNGATVTVDTVDGSGAVTGVTLTTKGSNYTTGTKTTTVAPAGGTGCTINVLTLQSATNANGGNLILASGIASGTGSSSVVIQTSPVGTTGATDNTLVNTLTIDPNTITFGAAGTTNKTLTINSAGGAGAVTAQLYTAAYGVYLTSSAWMSQAAPSGYEIRGNASSYYYIQNSTAGNVATAAINFGTGDASFGLFSTSAGSIWSTIPLMGAPTGTPSTSGGSMADGTYYYVVTAIDGAGGQTYKGTQSAAVTVTGGGTGSVSLTWTARVGAVSYKVYRTTVTNVYTSPALIGNPTTNSLVDTLLTPTAGNPNAGSTAYITKFTAAGNSWYNGGNFGIGTAVPTALLHVAGTSLFTGTTTHTGSMIVKSVTDAGPMTATNGTVAEIVYNTSDSKFYGCTVTGTPATWVAFN